MNRRIGIVRSEATERKMSVRQKQFISKLMLSSAFSAKEYGKTLDWLETQPSSESASKVIEKALARIEAAHKQRLDAAQRKEAYRNKTRKSS